MEKEVSEYLSTKEVISLPDYQDTAVSEDGGRVAYVRKIPDWINNTYRSHVWIYDAKIDKSYPVTAGEHEGINPSWSPDSGKLAYLSPVGKGGDKRQQIFIHTPLETETVQVSDAKESITSFKWAGDGKGFVYLANRPKSTKIEQRQELYGEFFYVGKDFQYNGLYFLAVGEAGCPPKPSEESGEAGDDSASAYDTSIPLIDSGDIFIKSYDVAPDGQKVVFSATPTPGFDDFFRQEIYLLDLETSEYAKLDITPLHVGEVLFSYDGLKLCYRRFEREQSIFNNTVPEIYDLKTKQATSLSIDIDENILPVRWTEKGILITWQEKTNIRIGLVTEAGHITPLLSSEDVVATHPSISSNGQNFAYIKATPQEAASVYSNHVKVTSQRTYYEGRSTSQKEIRRWKSYDGLDIEGILSKPANFDPSQTYPLIVAVHGGPAGTSFDTPTMHKYQPVEQFVEKGFLVLEPNYRGSAGYGEAFRGANYRQLGLGDHDDMMSGIDMLVEQGLVNPEQMGILGWSQGGYISAFCATYSNRFKATSVGAGISNWMTYYTNTDITHFTRFYLGDTPWNDETIYKKTSPMTYINNATTPTLIQHGEDDPRVPVPNAYELYRGLKDVGVDTELAIFKGMKHGSDKPGIHRAILKQNLDWFCHYVLGEEISENTIY